MAAASRSVRAGAMAAERKPGDPEAKFDDDDGVIAKQNWRPMPMAAISRGSLAVVRGAVEACSVSGKRPGVMRLITIGFSAYCEKVRLVQRTCSVPSCQAEFRVWRPLCPVSQVRWVLDLIGVDYTEDAHAPGFHAFATLPVTKGRASQTPVLVLSDGVATWDSTSIMKRLCTTYHREVGHLYPAGSAAQVEEYEEFLDENLGANTRQVSPSRDPCVCRAILTLLAPAWSLSCVSTPVAVLLHAERRGPGVLFLHQVQLRRGAVADAVRVPGPAKGPGSRTEAGRRAQGPVVAGDRQGRGHYACAAAVVSDGAAHECRVRCVARRCHTRCSPPWASCWQTGVSLSWETTSRRWILRLQRWHTRCFIHRNCSTCCPSLTRCRVA